MTDPDVLNYIKQSLAGGLSETDIRNTLLAQGRVASDVDQAFVEVANGKHKVTHVLAVVLMFVLSAIFIFGGLLIAGFSDCRGCNTLERFSALFYFSLPPVFLLWLGYFIFKSSTNRHKYLLSILLSISLVIVTSTFFLSSVIAYVLFLISGIVLIIISLWRGISEKMLPRLVIALCICSVIPWGYAKFYSYSESTNLAKVTISNIDDTPLLSDRGNPIGIKLSFSMRFPKTSRYQPITGIDVPTPGHSDYISFRALRVDITPPFSAPASAGWTPFPKTDYIYQAGVPYAFTIALLPNFISTQTPTGAIRPGPVFNDLCIRSFDERFLEAFYRDLKNIVNQQLQVDFYDGSLNELKRISFASASTEHSYTEQTFYDGAIKEGLASCR